MVSTTDTQSLKNSETSWPRSLVAGCSPVMKSLSRQGVRAAASKERKHCSLQLNEANRVAKESLEMQLNIK